MRTFLLILAIGILVLASRTGQAANSAAVNGVQGLNDKNTVNMNRPIHDVSSSDIRNNRAHRRRRNRRSDDDLLGRDLPQEEHQPYELRRFMSALQVLISLPEPNKN